MAHIPPTHKNQPPENDSDIPEDQETNEVKAIVDGLTDEQIDEAWDVEVQSWGELGLNPKLNITIDQFLFKSRLEMVIEVLMEQGIIEQESFNMRVRRYMLRTMIELRREHQRQMLQAKLMEGIHGPKPPIGGLFLPPGMSPNG